MCLHVAAGAAVAYEQPNGLFRLTFWDGEAHFASAQEIAVEEAVVRMEEWIAPLRDEYSS